MQGFIQFLLTNKYVKNQVGPVILEALKIKYQDELDNDGSITDEACEDGENLSKFLAARLKREKVAKDGSIKAEKASKVAFEVVKTGVQRVFQNSGDESWMPFLDCGLIAFLSVMSLKDTEAIGELLLNH